MNVPASALVPRAQNRFCARRLRATAGPCRENENYNELAMRPVLSRVRRCIRPRGTQKCRGAVSTLVPARGGPLFRHFVCFKVTVGIEERSETLEVGSRAPGFTLKAVDGSGLLTLSGFLGRETLSVKFRCGRHW